MSTRTPLLLVLSCFGYLAPAFGQRVIFDPDLCLSCPDTRDHILAGTGLDVGLQLVFPRTSPGLRIGIVTAIAVVYEVGQESIVREDPSKRAPGYGFGVKDLLAGIAGAVVAEGGRALWRKLH